MVSGKQRSGQRIIHGCKNRENSAVLPTLIRFKRRTHGFPAVTIVLIKYTLFDQREFQGTTGIIVILQRRYGSIISESKCIIFESEPYHGDHGITAAVIHATYQNFLSIT